MTLPPTAAAPDSPLVAVPILGPQHGILHHGILHHGVSHYGVANHGVANHGVAPQAAPSFESPSLAARGDAPAFEMKFLVDEAMAQRVEAWARQKLALDPHGDAALGGAYRTVSLYCDTPQFDVYFRSPTYKRRKFRVRRYGLAPWVFLERKSKRKDRVKKRRTAVSTDDLTLLERAALPADWQGQWFHHRLQAKRLGPACRVSYLRSAYAGTSAEGPLRLTLDRRLHGIATEAWTLDPFEAGLPLLAERVILELKFRSALPAAFKHLVRDLRLNPSPVSKYRLGLAACGVAPAQESLDA